MRDPAASRGSRTHLNRAHPAGLRHRDVRDRPPPHVLTMRRHGVRVDLITRSGWPSSWPASTRWPAATLRRRHILGIAQRRARIHPPHDGRDLLVGERQVVGEFRHADRLIEMPGRHLRRDTLPDGFGPGTRLFVGHQRHRSHGAGRWHSGIFPGRSARCPSRMSREYRPPSPRRKRQNPIPNHRKLFMIPLLSAKPIRLILTYALDYCRG